MLANEDSVIFTTQAGAGQYGLNELQKAGIRASGVQWLGDGIGRAAVEGGFEHLAEAFRREPPVFIRHICPAQIRVDHDCTIAALDLFAEEAARCFASRLDLKRTFSVQAVFLPHSDRAYKRYDLNQRITAPLIEMGATIDVTRPEQVISVVHLPDVAYMGLSDAADNISRWAGGVHRFAREADQISRAGFKLLEALEVFQIKLPADGTALDLGAAPGGWTRVLRERGLQVVAVDPAALEPRLAQDPGVTYFQGTAQKYLESPGTFDIIVNDMCLDIKQSTDIMGSLASCLNKDGLAVMTLKLPHKGMQKSASNGMRMLTKWYEIAGARQLYHNRSEITVLLRPR